MPPIFSLLMPKFLAAGFQERHMEAAGWGRELSSPELMIGSATRTAHRLYYTEITSVLFSHGNEISYVMLCGSKLHSSSFMLHRLLDHCDHCAKLIVAAEGQKQLTPEPCSLKAWSPLMHFHVLEHPTATLELRLWLVQLYQVIKIYRSSLSSDQMWS